MILAKSEKEWQILKETIELMKASKKRSKELTPKNEAKKI